MSQIKDSALVIQASSRTVSVMPGRQASLTLTLSNQNTLPVALELAIQGFFESWLAIQPEALVLSPYQSASVILTCSPPADAPLGSYPVTLWARVRDNPSVGARSDLVLVLGDSVQLEPEAITAIPESAPVTKKLPQAAQTIEPPVGGPVELALTPASQRIARSAQFMLRVTNRGAIPLDLELHPVEPSGAYTCEFNPPHLRLSQDSEGTVRIRVRSRVPLQAGETRRVTRLGIEVSAQYLPQPVLVEGTLTQEARPWWKGPIGWILALVLVAALVLGSWLVIRWFTNRPPQPKTEPTPYTQPTARPAPTRKEIEEPTEKPREPVRFPGIAFDVEEKNENINVRAGPGMEYEIIAKLKHNTEVTITGRAPGNDWLYIVQPKLMIEGWVNAKYIQTSGDIDLLDVIR